MNLPSPITAGLDEAGRGALAGPVVAGACILTLPLFRRRHTGSRLWSPFRRIPDRDCLIADSKVLTPEEREIAYRWITHNCHWGVGMASSDYIEEHGILKATERAMHLALEQLCLRMTPELLLIDGRDAFTFPIPHQSIIRGDSIEPCIAAASIIAKVTRDRWMAEQDQRFPVYGFAQHKGYGTEEHRTNIQKHGTCSLHRQTFIHPLPFAPESPCLRDPPRHSFLLRHDKEHPQQHSD